MKLALSGKGGVGKSTLAAALILLMKERGHRVLAVDADPDANLASALGFPSEIRSKVIPISQQIALIEERTGAKVKKYGQVFKLNPDVSDVAEKAATTYNEIPLLVIGAIEKGGSGCACPENVFIRSLITDLVLYKNEALVLDMEAGIEHLGRATAKSVDIMLIVVEPGQRSIDCAESITRMSRDIGINNVYFVANKIADAQDEAFIRESLDEERILASIPNMDGIRQSDQTGCSVLEHLSPEQKSVFNQLLDQLESL